MFRADLLKEKVVIVTGGGSGLGQSMAVRFAELGAQVVVTGRTQGKLEQTVKTITDAGGKASFSICDVRQAAEVEATVAEVAKKFGHLDIYVNNAAGNFLAQSEKLSPNGFAAIVNIVLNGSFHGALYAGRQMIAQKTGGSILSITTTYAWTGSAYVLPSACAKAGVLAMTRSLAVEWARHKIRCNAIAPGPFPTEGAWSRLIPPGMEEMGGGLVASKVPLGRYGEHHELANLAAYMVADESGYMTGECVTIDGGEWLMGGEFNALTQFDQTALGQMFDAVRPKKK